MIRCAREGCTDSEITITGGVGLCAVHRAERDRQSLEAWKGEQDAHIVAVEAAEERFRLACANADRDALRAAVDRKVAASGDPKWLSRWRWWWPPSW